MELEFLPAVIAGALGGLAMTAVRTVLRRLGVPLPLDIPRLWGAMLALTGMLAWLVGFAIHIGGSGLVAVVYAFAFGLLALASHLWAWGLLGGVIHWLIAGLFMAAVPWLTFDRARDQPLPGPFVLSLGRA